MSFNIIGEAATSLFVNSSVKCFSMIWPFLDYATVIIALWQIRNDALVIKNINRF
jgi:hypothetical protein